MILKSTQYCRGWSSLAQRAVSARVHPLVVRSRWPPGSRHRPPWPHERTPIFETSSVPLLLMILQCSYYGFDGLPARVANAEGASSPPVPWRFEPLRSTIFKPKASRNAQFAALYGESSRCFRPNECVISTDFGHLYRLYASVSSSGSPLPPPHRLDVSADGYSSQPDPLFDSVWAGRGRTSGLRGGPQVRFCEICARYRRDTSR